MRVLVVTNMYPQPDQPASGTFVKEQEEALRHQGVEVDVLLVDGPRNKLNYLWGPFRLWWQLLRKRYDVVHAHYVLSGIVARMQPFLPVVVTYHGSELGVNPKHWLFRLSRAAHRFFQQVIVVSPEMKQKLDAHNVQVIPCGINLNTIKPISLPEARQQLGLPPFSPLVLWIGNPERVEKRYSLMKQAMELVKQELPEAELVLVSGQPYSMMPIFMSACDVLALTSVREGSPMVIKEAMACNLPIVSVDVGDVSVVIDGTEHCYLVVPTPDAVADKLLMVLTDRRRTDGRSKIDRLEAGFIAGRVIEVYEQVSKPSVGMPTSRSHTEG